MPAKDRQPLANEIKEGLVFVVRHPLISRIAACTGGVNFFTTIGLTLMPVLVLRELKLGPQGMGHIMAVRAVGGLIGAVAAPRFAAWIGEETVIPVASVISSLFLLLVPLCVLTPERWMSPMMLIVSEFGFAFGVLVYNITQLSMRQRVCPPRLLGRMNASIRFVAWGVMPIAALASGLLAENLGLVPTLWIGLGGSIVCVAPVLFSPLWGMRRLPNEVHSP